MLCSLVQVSSEHSHLQGIITDARKLSNAFLRILCGVASRSGQEDTLLWTRPSSVLHFADVRGYLENVASRGEDAWESDEAPRQALKPN